MASRPRVLLSVHTAGRGGAELMALAEARYLSEFYDLTIAVPEGPLRAEFATLGDLADGTASLPLWGASAARWLSRCARTAIGAAGLLRVIARVRPDAVLTNSSVSLAPVIAARLAGVPAVVHARDVPVSRLSPIVFRLHGALADTVVVIADELARRFRRSRRARVLQIYEGIAVPKPPPAGRQRTTGEPLRLCLVGGIDPRKGQDLAVDALALLRDRGIAATLELVGREIDAGFAAALRERAAREAVSARVRFAGELPDVRAALARADVVIAPSRSEWTPLSLMEGMAAERPVVAARVGGIAEIVPDGEAGILVPAEDARALADALAELAADPARARALGRRGREHVVEHLDIRRSLAELRSELDRLISARQAGQRSRPARGRRAPGSPPRPRRQGSRP